MARRSRAPSSADLRRQIRTARRVAIGLNALPALATALALLVICFGPSGEDWYAGVGVILISAAIGSWACLYAILTVVAGLAEQAVTAREQAEASQPPVAEATAV